MTTKQLKNIHRGDQIVTPKGNVTVTSFRINDVEDFTGRNTRPVTVTIEGTLNGKSVRLTAPETSTVEIAN